MKSLCLYHPLDFFLYIKETFDYDVVCCCVNCGQGNELDGLDERAKLSGASKLYIEDIVDEFCDDFIVPCVQIVARCFAVDVALSIVEFRTLPSPTHFMYLPVFLVFLFCFCIYRKRELCPASGRYFYFSRSLQMSVEYSPTEIFHFSPLLVQPIRGFLLTVLPVAWFFNVTVATVALMTSHVSGTHAPA